MTIYATDLIRRLAAKHGKPQAHYHAALTHLMEGITEELAQGNSVQLIGFGTFYTHTQPEAQITHIRSGKPLTIPAHLRVGFRVGEALRQAVMRPTAGEHGQPTHSTKPRLAALPRGLFRKRSQA